MDVGGGASEGFHVLVASSGTTGEPKIARHRLQALLGRIRRRPSKHESARWLLTYQPASFAGLQVILTALVSGDELVAVSELGVRALTDAALKWLPTHISATPTFWRSFLVAAGHKLSQVPLAHLTLGGEVADQSTLDSLRAAFPASGVTHIYATTEAGALFAVKDGVAGFPVEWLVNGIEGVELRIIDGVLEVRSPRSMMGYLGGEGKTSLTTSGWLRTGDLVTIRDNRVHFLGRIDTVISVGGAKVTPEEVEHVLVQTPGVLDARAFGVSNVITGSVVGAEIVTDVQNHEGLRREIIAHLKGRLEPYKVPRIIRFVQSIPTYQSGKKRRLDERR
jgi:acyl-coenzyme A synthetase/AMP-(fatty) acid ligase